MGFKTSLMSIRKSRIFLLRLSCIPLIFLAVFVRPRWSVGSDTAFVIELCGYLFLLAGLAVRMWSILYIGGRKSQQLITAGPYSLCRHPLYIGTFLLAIGAAVCFENVLLLAAIILLFIPLHLIVARLEDHHLELRFPREYCVYAQRVPSFWPRFRNYHGKKELLISTRVIGRVMLDTMAVLLIPQLEDLLEVLHDTGVIPVLWHFP